MTEYCLTAEMMPMGMAIVQVKTMVKSPKITVIIRRSFTRSVTGL